MAANNKSFTETAINRKVYAVTDYLVFGQRMW